MARYLGCDVAVVASDKRDVVAPELVIEAARAGEVVDCRDGDRRGVVDAALLRGLCRERLDEVDDRGVHLRNALVTGDLDLSAVTVPFPLTFEGCRFEAPLQVSGATLQELTVLRCELPGLLGNGVNVRRDLNLSGSAVTGAPPYHRERLPIRGDLVVRVPGRWPAALRGHHHSSPATVGRFRLTG